MKNNYPALYRDQKDFFEDLQDPKERKKLYYKNKGLVLSVPGGSRRVMDEWTIEDSGDYDDDF
jgi:hypothetical protein